MKWTVLAISLVASEAAAGGWSGAIQKFERRPNRPATGVVRVARPAVGTVGVRPVVVQNGTDSAVVSPDQPVRPLTRGLDRTPFTDTYNRSAVLRAARTGASTPTFRRYYAPRGIPNGPAD